MNYNPLTSLFILLSIYGFSYSLFIYTLQSSLFLILILYLLLLNLRILLFNNFKVYNPFLNNMFLKEKR